MEPPQAQNAPLTPRAVPLTHAFAWFEAALRTFKHAPWRWCLLGFITLATEFLLRRVPGIGVAAAEVFAPVVECGMLLAAAAVERGAPVELRFATAAFSARPAALAAIVMAALFVFAIEALVASALAGVNLIVEPDAAMNDSTLLVVSGAATAASLPVAFVPMAVLLQQASFGRAFATSARAFALNVAPLVLFGLLSLLLTVIGLITLLALVAVYPLLVLASYAAWKDIYGGQPPLTPS